ncbi:S-layer homology domain-containing protein [Iningainema tapete]|uniref:S-layer homology domain-containing protein n=1 Tax=Iningainema tapete BLCC-T55 TaxID=2748662 RepID=A0A8J7C9S0_9CYAN|nr:S-layer homology domain-containing protein [Iningainema tapete]MBD2776281.1 S-layer homology domain-containing protein [Iningainema tapete BLCC-T55]
MYKISSIARFLNLATFVTTLALVTVFSYPLKTRSQTPSNATPQSGCLSGYANGTVQGDRPITRNEFAAGLNACLNQVNQLIPTNRENLATKADLEVLLKRHRELNEQLRELNGRVNNVAPAQK